MKDEARMLVAFLASHPRPRGYPRLSFLAAPIVGDAELLHTPHETMRNEAIASASAAELTGDHERASRLLAEIVAAPSFTWDYPERAALLRNLRARHDAAKIEALCADTARPACSPAFLVVLARAAGSSRDHVSFVAAPRRIHVSSAAMKRVLALVVVAGCTGSVDGTAGGGVAAT